MRRRHRHLRVVHACTNLIDYTKALEAAGTAIKLVMRVPAPLKSIADQLIRSAGSIPANLAEGHGRSGRDRQHHWRIADASDKEVDSHLQLLAAAVDCRRPVRWVLLSVPGPTLNLRDLRDGRRTVLSPWSVRPGTAQAPIRDAVS